jgi:diguanylate cyclase (GGDEF)-like protein
MDLTNINPQSIAYKQYIANRHRRLTQIFWGIEGLFIALSCIQILSQNYLTASILLSSCLPFFIVYFLLKAGRTDLAAIVIFSFLLIIIFGLVWQFYGLRDLSLMAIPVLLIFSAFLAKPKVFFIFLALAIINILAIGYVNYAGIYNHPEPGNSFTSAVSWSVLILFLTASIRLLGIDMQRMSKRLAKQNEYVEASRSKAQHLINHDILTDLPNKTAADDKLAQYVFAHDKVKHDCVMLLDLDNFKRINDSMGHNFGDQYLIEISQRLNSALDELGNLYHIGGDKFLVIIENTDDIAIRNLISDIQQCLKKSHIIGDINVKSTTSIGIATARDSDQTYEELRLQADIALGNAKARGRNSYCYHNPQFDEELVEHAQLQIDLKNAISNDELSIAFQPKISLTTNAIVGAEAVIRWTHPTRGAIDPKVFLLLAEKSGLIFDIGDWMIDKACIACNRWVNLGHEIPVAVSSSLVQFSSGKIIESVERNLMFTDLSGHHLELQVAEALFVDNSPNLISTLNILKTMGITIVINNFGTGYSNLGNLKKYDIDALKIDQSFIKNLDDNYDNAIVHAIINIAKGLDIKVIGEGIEVTETIDILSGMGCDIGQGQFWSKALTADHFIEFLEKTAK